MENEVTFSFVILSLVVRYLGVVGVLVLLMFGIIVAGAIFQRLELRRVGAEKKALAERELEGISMPPDSVNPEIVAAIAIALDLNNRQSIGTQPPAPSSRGPSAWVVAGRVQQLCGNRPR